MPWAAPLVCDWLFIIHFVYCDLATKKSMNSLSSIFERIGGGNSITTRQV